jgi:ankyrin repeat protein/beta-lactamase regulating signal transducer with metallopeptidase domain
METVLIRITGYLLSQSWQIALLVTVIGLVNAVLRNKSAHVRYLLWLIVLAKCLVPPFYAVPLAILPEQEQAEPAAMAPPSRVLPLEREPMDAMMAEPAESPSIPFEMPVPVVERGRRSISVHELLGIGWMVGACAFLAFNLLRALRANLWLWRRRQALPAELRTKIENLFSAHSVRSLPDVWLVEGFNQPFVWGLLRGSIYLPVDFLNINRPEHQKSILGHEISHILRFDAAVNILQVIAQAVFWFHPLVWWMNRNMRAEREKCCDEMAIARLNTLPRDYGTAILETLAAKYKQTRPVPSLAVAGPVRNIEERIRTMLKPGRKFYKHPTLTAVTVALLFAVCAVPTTLVLTARAEARALESRGKDNPNIYHSTIEGNISQVQLFISNGGNVDKKDPQGQTPLHYAAWIGRKDVAEVLIAKGANINERDVSGQTPLHCAATFGSNFVPELLLSKGANINARDNKGNTPLHLAAGSCEVDRNFLEFMLTQGADVNARNGQGQTALHLVPRTSRQDFHRELAAGALLAHGAQVNAKDNGNSTPLHVAAEYGQKKVAELLLDRGADINGAQWNGWTALHYAAEAGHSDVAELLIARGAEVDAESKDGETPLDAAALAGEVKLCAMLIAKGAKVDSLYSASASGGLDKVENFIKEGSSAYEKEAALFAAAACGQEGVAELLVAKGADVNTRNKYWVTPLHLACKKGYVDIARLLLANKARVDARTPKGWTPLHFAAENGHKDVAALLIDKGADVNAENSSKRTPFDSAVLNGHKEVAELLLHKGAVVTVVKTAPYWPLYSACAHGQRDLAELFIQKGALTDIPDSWSPAHDAVWNQHPSMLALLFDHGADPNAQDRCGWSLLHYAGGFPDMVRLLLEKGANPNIVERERGRTPLHNVAAGQHEGRDYKKVAELLISYGANVNTKDWDGKTPLCLAQETGHAQIVELLKRHGAKE